MNFGRFTVQELEPGHQPPRTFMEGGGGSQVYGKQPLLSPFHESCQRSGKTVKAAKRSGKAELPRWPGPAAQQLSLLLQLHSLKGLSLVTSAWG